VSNEVPTCRSSGGDVQVTSTLEDTKVIVGRRGTKESVVRSRSWGSSGRKTIENVGGSVETLRPEARGKRSLDQKGAHNIVRGANLSLSLAVPGRCLRTRHTSLDTPREKEGTRGVVIELAPVVTLDCFDGEAELSGHPGKEVEEGGKRLILGT
jgi:hypothetical protein